MTLEEVLSNRNVNDHVYTCDVRRWIGYPIGFRDAERLANDLTIISKGISDEDKRTE